MSHEGGLPSSRPDPVRRRRHRRWGWWAAGVAMVIAGAAAVMRAIGMTLAASYLWAPAPPAADYWAAAVLVLVVGGLGIMLALVVARRRGRR